MQSAIYLLVSNFKMNFRNKQAISWTFVMPVIIMTLFGLAFGKEQTISMKVAVIDRAHNAASKEFVKGLKKVGSFKVTAGNEEGEMRSLKDGDRTAVIVLPKDFGRGVQTLLESERNAQSGLSGGMPGLRKSVGRPPKIEASVIKVYYDEANPTLTETARMLTSQIVSGMNQKASGAPQLFKLSEEKVSTRKLSNIDFYAAGIIAMVTMQGGIMQVIMILVGYRERGILRRLKATPMSTSFFMGSQIFVRVMIALVQMGILLALAVLEFGAHVAGSPWLLGALVVEGALVFIALGFTLASFARTNQTAMAMAQIVTLPMMFLSGIFFPTDAFPKYLQPLIKALPLSYLADGLRQVMMRGADFNAVSHDMAILGLYGLVLFSISVLAFRWE